MPYVTSEAALGMLQVWATDSAVDRASHATGTLTTGHAVRNM
jgi:hypothetical protein